jgi:hypothetical protein
MAKSNKSTMAPADVLLRRWKRTDYELLPTEVEGLSLRVERGKNPQLMKRNLGRLATSGRMVARLRGQISRHQAREEEKKEVIKDLARAHDGLRGFTSEADNLSTTVYPSHKLGFVREKLQEMLGAAYPALVGEELLATITVPLGNETPYGTLSSEMVRAGLMGTLSGLGFPESDIEKILDIKIGLRVDEAKLGEMVANGQVQLIEGVANVEETWTVTTAPLRKD